MKNPRRLIRYVAAQCFGAMGTNGKRSDLSRAKVFVGDDYRVRSGPNVSGKEIVISPGKVELLRYGWDGIRQYNDTWSSKYASWRELMLMQMEAAISDSGASMAVGQMALRAYESATGRQHPDRLAFVGAAVPTRAERRTTMSMRLHEFVHTSPEIARAFRRIDELVDGALYVGRCYEAMASVTVARASGADGETIVLPAGTCVQVVSVSHRANPFLPWSDEATMHLRVTSAGQGLDAQAELPQAQFLTAFKEVR